MFSHPVSSAFIHTSLARGVGYSGPDFFPQNSCFIAFSPNIRLPSHLATPFSRSIKCQEHSNNPGNSFQKQNENEKDEKNKNIRYSGSGRDSTRPVNPTPSGSNTISNRNQNRNRNLSRKEKLSSHQSTIKDKDKQDQTTFAPLNSNRYSSTLPPTHFDLADADIVALETQLRCAVARQHFSEAAQIHSKLKSIHASEHMQVLAANRQYYAAINAESVSALKKIWLEAASYASVYHPFLEIRKSTTQVIESYRKLFSSNKDKRATITPTQLRVIVSGSLGLVMCIESLTPKQKNTKLIAAKVSSTSIFQKVNGEWKMIHHHGSAMIDRKI